MNDQAILQVVYRLRLVRVVHALKPLLMLPNYGGFRRLRAVTAPLALASLRQRQPRFLYKFIAPYALNSLRASERLAVLTHHYAFFAARANAAFFPALAGQPVIWRTCCGPDEFTIALSFPLHVANEAELSLHLYCNTVLTQVVSLVVVPGPLVGAASPNCLLLSQVQGFGNAEQIRHATKALHDISPAMLLVHAAYGLARAWQLDCAVGVSTRNKAGTWVHRHFDYDTFWLELRGEPQAAHELYRLPMPPPERPLAEIRRNHRARTLRKRQFKTELRDEVTRHWRATFAATEPSPAPGAPGSRDAERRQQPEYNYA